MWRWDGNQRNEKDPEYEKVRGSFRYHHLKSFKTELMKKIKLSDLQYDNGTLFRYAMDVAFYQPMIEISCYKIASYEEEVQYIETANVKREPSDLQKVVSDSVWGRKKADCDPEFKRKMESKDPFEFRAFKSYLEETPESTEVHTLELYSIPYLGSISVQITT